MQEAAEFLRGHLGLALDRDQLEAITRTTDGWVAGIYLAALSLQAGADPRAAIDALAGGDQRVREYVEAEVLDKLAPDRLQFLAAVAVLERFSPALCDAVFERSDSEAVLRELEHSNLFVIPLDRTGTWFRLHHFFASLLRQCESSPRGAELVRLYERAAAWHREHDDVIAAIRCLIEADHPDDAGALRAAAYPRYVNTSRLGAILRSWLEMLPAEVVERSPGLCLMAAWVAGFEGAGQELEHRLEQAVSLPSSGPLPDGSASAAAEAALVRSVFCAGDVEAGRRNAHEAVRLDRRGSPWWPVSRALEGIWGFLVDGPTDAVLAILEEAAPRAAAAGQDIVAATAYGDAAVLMLQRGAMASAELAARRCIDVRERSGIGRVPQAAATWWTTSRVHLAAGRLQEAVSEAESTVAFVADIAPEQDSILLVPPCLIQLARVRLEQGELAAAGAALAEARDRLARASQPGVVPEWLAEVEQQVRLHARDTPGVAALTAREIAVLRLLAGPATLREIADELHVSHNTIKSHAKAIYGKLRVSGRADAARRAHELGLAP